MTQKRLLIEPNTTNHKTPDRRAEAQVAPTLIWLTTNSFYANQSDYIFPNLNFAVLEYIFKISSNFLSPWFRFEKNTHPSKDLTAK
jgi:hypothetical protein